MPQLAVDPGHAGHEAVRFDRAQDRARIGIDLVDLAAGVIADPQRPLGPGQPGRVPFDGRRQCLQHLTGRGVNLPDASARELPQVTAVEGRPGVGGNVNRAHDGAAVGVEGVQAIAGSNPHLPAVEGHPRDVRDAGQWSIFAQDFDWLECLDRGLISQSGAWHLSVDELVRPQRGGEQQGCRESGDRRGDPAPRPTAAQRTHGAARGQLTEGALQGALADAGGTGQRTGRPGGAVLDQRANRDRQGRPVLERRRQTATPRPRAGDRRNPAGVAVTAASPRNTTRRRPISTRSRARNVSFGMRAPKASAIRRARGASSGHASASARASANSTGRLDSAAPARRARTVRRIPSTTRSFDASVSSTTASVTSVQVPRRPSRAQGRSSAALARSISAISAATPDDAAAVRARESARSASSARNLSHRDLGASQMVEGHQRRGGAPELDRRQRDASVGQAPEQQ